MLGIQTQGSRMEGADKSIELWRYPYGKVIWQASDSSLSKELQGSNNVDSPSTVCK